MSEQSPYLVPPYTALAGVYDQAGYSEFALKMVPHYLNHALSLDWVGRRVLELGCGTGLSTWWVSQQGYRAAGIDTSPHMLDQAGAQGEKFGDLLYDSPIFSQIDLRQCQSPLGPVDLALAVGGTLNALQSLRDLEITFGSVNRVLDDARLFIFDVFTIQGLAMAGGAGDQVDYDNGDDLLIMVRNQFNYEMLSNTRHYLIWQRQGEGWQRREEIHRARGFPLQGIKAMLERTGFRLLSTHTLALEPFDLQRDPAPGQVVFVAQKQAAGGS